MSKKYFDRLMTGSGYSGKKVKSKFGEAMLKKMGWNESKGLGKNQHGETECFQIKRREEGAGLGTEEQKEKGKFKWNDEFWIKMYDNVAKKITEQHESDPTDSSDDEITIVKHKKIRVSQSMKIDDKMLFKAKSSKDESKKKRKLKRRNKIRSFKVDF
eukprot:CAMPEP_0197004630 /NCGR_PEP_ID=MMETSP1380-20130617/24306_1 /TAXON_ID=5936 /ORGANISM="Euplotes crassus, Strain CT5" /LENGTH=157 /DNA_ID=CAMNT_0042423489 /DNA_START=7 /DNA_END=480 /DNA_ORIENTATION=-